VIDAVKWIVHVEIFGLILLRNLLLLGVLMLPDSFFLKRMQSKGMLSKGDAL
jgi:hypothetical protein